MISFGVVDLIFFFFGYLAPAVGPVIPGIAMGFRNRSMKIEFLYAVSQNATVIVDFS